MEIEIKLKIKIGEHEFELTEGEAEELQAALEKFRRREKVFVPLVEPNQTFPYQPPIVTYGTPNQFQLNPCETTCRCGESNG